MQLWGPDGGMEGIIESRVMLSPRHGGRLWGSRFLCSSSFWIMSGLLGCSQYKVPLLLMFVSDHFTILASSLFLLYNFFLKNLCMHVSVLVVSIYIFLEFVTSCGVGYWSCGYIIYFCGLVVLAPDDLFIVYSLQNVMFR